VLKISALTELRTLDLSSCNVYIVYLVMTLTLVPKLTEATLLHVMKQCTSLTTIYLPFTGGVTDKLVQQIGASCPLLERCVMLQ
jgi:hypothetical protein